MGPNELGSPIEILDLPRICESVGNLTRLLLRGTICDAPIMR